MRSSARIATALGLAATLIVASLVGWRLVRGRGAPGLLPRGPSTVVHEVTSVSGERALFMSAGSRERKVTVYLHGRCDDPRDALSAVGAALLAHGHVVAPVGTGPCPGGHGTMYTADIAALERQVDMALDAAEQKSGLLWERSSLTIVGYSQGAARAEDLARRSPRYKRVVLIGAPETPQVAALAGASAVALLAGERDRQDLMKTGEMLLKRAGKPVRFFLLPDAEHGHFGPEGDRVMGEAMAFVMQAGAT